MPNTLLTMSKPGCLPWKIRVEPREHAALVAALVLPFVRLNQLGIIGLPRTVLFAVRKQPMVLIWCYIVRTLDFGY